MYLPRVFTSQSHFNPGQHDLKCPHNRRQFHDTGGKCDDSVKSDYDSQPSGLEGEWSELSCDEDGYSSAAEVLNIIKQEDDHASKRVSIFLIDIADSFLRSTQQEDGWITSQLVDWLSATSFETNVFRKCIKSFTNGKHVNTEIKRSSWGTMDFIKSWWETEIQGMMAVTHHVWRTWLTCFQRRLKFAETIVLCSVRRV